MMECFPELCRMKLFYIPKLKNNIVDIYIFFYRQDYAFSAMINCINRSPMFVKRD